MRRFAPTGCAGGHAAARLLLATLLATLAWPSGACTPCRPSPGDGSSLRESRALGERLRLARDAGDLETADALVDQLQPYLSGRVYNDVVEAIAEYSVFERGRCQLATLPSSKRAIAEQDAWVREGMLACQAARLPESDGPEARALLRRLVDGRVESLRASDVYDRFARQATLDVAALRWLHGHSLADVGFEGATESALIAQVRAGRADNVDTLLDLGYDANQPIARRMPRSPDDADGDPGHGRSQALPLQAARDALPRLGGAAIAVARVLLAHGANPNLLKWHRYTPAAVAVDPGLQARWDALLRDAPAATDPVGALFQGLVFEPGLHGETAYASFLVGNGSDAPIRIAAWTDRGDYLLDSLHQARIEFHRSGGSTWDFPVVLQDGFSPGSGLTLQPGDSREVLVEWDMQRALSMPADVRYRLRFMDDDRVEAHHSEPFVLHDPARPPRYRVVQGGRRWYRPP